MSKFLPETETTVPIIRGPGEGKVVGVLRDQSTFKVLSEETGGAYAILEQKIRPGHGPRSMFTASETEIFLLLEGEFEITIGGQKVTAAAGAIVVGPRDIPPHVPQRRLARRAPASDCHPQGFANYFIDVDGVDDGDHAAIRALIAKYDVDGGDARRGMILFAPRVPSMSAASAHSLFDVLRVPER